MWGSGVLSGAVGWDGCRAAAREARGWEGTAGSCTEAEAGSAEAVGLEMKKTVVKARYKETVMNSGLRVGPVLLIAERSGCRRKEAASKYVPCA